MSTRVQASVRRNIGKSGNDYGHELTIERVSEHGERSAGLVIGELSLEDLKAIGVAIRSYLNGNPE